MAQTLKAGCILINQATKQIGLIYRKKLNDYSFPKGHLEENETIEECAVRETAEETKRDCKIVINEPIMNEYITPNGENCICYMYLALDTGASNNTSEDTHDLVWVDLEKVIDILTYDSLKQVWKKAYQQLLTIIDKF